MPRKTKAQTNVIHDEVEIPTEILAQAIVDLSAAGRALLNSRLKKRTLMLLLKDASGVSLHQIEKILDALPQLEKEYLK